MNISVWRHVRNFLMGIGSTVEIAPRRVYMRPGRSGFRRDVAALRKDHAKVGDDVRSALKAVNG